MGVIYQQTFNSLSLAYPGLVASVKLSDRDRQGLFIVKVNSSIPLAWINADTPVIVLLFSPPLLNRPGDLRAKSLQLLQFRIHCGGSFEWCLGLVVARHEPLNFSDQLFDAGEASAG